MTAFGSVFACFSLHTIMSADICIMGKNIYLSVSTPVVMRPKFVHFNFKRDDERACLYVSFILLWQNCNFDKKKNIYQCCETLPNKNSFV